MTMKRTCPRGGLLAAVAAVAACSLASVIGALSLPAGCDTEIPDSVETGSNCANGFDDDGDSLIDCDDPDCAGECQGAGSPVAEICNNGVDDDGDLAEDCEDSDCEFDQACLYNCFYLAPNDCQVSQQSVADQNDRLTYRTADAFQTPIPFDVGGVCWWGVKPPTNVAPDSFRIRYFQDDLGYPGLVVAAFSESDGTLEVQSALTVPAYQVSFYDDITGETMDLDSMQYVGAHAPLALSADRCYWIEITNGDAWGWEESVPTDGRSVFSYMNDDPTNYLSNDFVADYAFCLKPAPATGACCDGAECLLSTEADCAGVYQGDGTDCDPDPCTAALLGACCIGGGDCYVISEAACGGVYLGDGTLCGDPPCPPDM